MSLDTEFRYVAFVITDRKISRIELGSANDIEGSIGAWRTAILNDEQTYLQLQPRIRQLLWAKLRSELPSQIGNVYISPDAAFCRVPWSAIQGDLPGDLLLDDFSLAVVPHPQFLLRKAPHPAIAPPSSRVLVVGAVDYDTMSKGHKTVRRNRNDSEKQPRINTVSWPELTGAATESNAVAHAARSHKHDVLFLNRHHATVNEVLRHLPQAHYAHIATHGFFIAPTLAKNLGVNADFFQKSPYGERIGVADRNPLLMVGLAFAGANVSPSPLECLASGQTIAELNLSHLDLAVLSACETGVGDVAGGEGSFGLSRSFHLAGTHNVVASLWRVSDDATATLMTEFYKNLWDRGLSPLESLRQAQLEMYRNPNLLANDSDRTFKEVAGSPTAKRTMNTTRGSTRTALWAGFVLSGNGQ